MRDIWARNPHNCHQKLKRTISKPPMMTLNASTVFWFHKIRSSALIKLLQSALSRISLIKLHQFEVPSIYSSITETFPWRSLLPVTTEPLCMSGAMCLPELNCRESSCIKMLRVAGGKTTAARSDNALPSAGRNSSRITERNLLSLAYSRPPHSFHENIPKSKQTRSKTTPCHTLQSAQRSCVAVDAVKPTVHCRDATTK